MGKKVIGTVAILLICAVICICFVGCNDYDSHFEVIDISKEVFIATVTVSSYLSGSDLKLDVEEIEWAKEIQSLKRDGQYATAVKFVDTSKAKEFADEIQAGIDKARADAGAEGIAFVDENNKWALVVERKGTLVVYGRSEAVKDTIKYKLN